LFSDKFEIKVYGIGYQLKARRALYNQIKRFTRLL